MSLRVHETMRPETVRSILPMNLLGKDRDMEQIDIFVLHELGRWLDSCFLSLGKPLNQNINAWAFAYLDLDMLLQDAPGLPRLDVSRRSAERLRDVLSEAIGAHASAPDCQLSDASAERFRSAFGEFEQMLRTDLARAPVFFVTQKGIYSTGALIHRADTALPDDILDRISQEARRDVADAGRCLAFQLSTACAYHALRAVEKVLRECYVKVVGEPTHWTGMCQAIKGLRDAGANEEVVTLLDDIRVLYRNRIDHPDLFLEMGEAIEVFSVCISAISVMTRRIL